MRRAEQGRVPQFQLIQYGDDVGDVSSAGHIGGVTLAGAPAMLVDRPGFSTGQGASGAVVRAVRVTGSR